MKKIYFLLLALTGLSFAGSAQCTVNVNDTVTGISPPDSLFPVMVQSQALGDSFVAQMYVPATLSSGIITATILWVVIDPDSGITGLPTGVTYGKTPVNDTIYGGNRQCIYLQGTPTDTPGTYPLTFHGWIHVNVGPPVNIDTVVTFQQLQNYAAILPGIPQFNYAVKEIAASGINDNNHFLASAMHIVPNPNDGVFDLRTNYSGNMEGDLKVIDATGKVIFTQKLSSNGFYNTTVDLRSFAKGLYTVQIVTADAVGTKVISVE